MFDTEKMILEIQNFPCLWDMSSPSYNDRDLKRSCWHKVAESLYPEWGNLDEKEKEEKVKEIKDKKWRHIRDAYMKYVSDEKNVRSGSEGNKRKTYTYAESLSFLNITVKKRKTTGNLEFENSTLDTSLNVHEDNDKTESPVNTVDFSNNLPPKKNNNKKSLSTFQQNLLEHLKEDGDSDKNIVMSFLPYIKKLNDDEKLDFQVHTLQYLKNIIQKHNSPLTQYPQNQPSPVPTGINNNFHYSMSTPSLSRSLYSQHSMNTVPVPNYALQSLHSQQLSYPDYSNNQTSETSPTYIHQYSPNNTQTNNKY